MGYYPIPQPVIEKIVTLLHAPKGGRVLDPCAGEGEALITLAQRLDLEPYGVELHDERAAILRQKVEEMTSELEPKSRVYHTGIERMNIGRSSFNLLYLNPPFDTDDSEGRSELRFLKTTFPRLQEGGVLVFVVPQHFLTHKKSQQYLASRLREVRVFRHPSEDREYGEIVLIGYATRVGVAHKETIQQLEGMGRGMLPIPVLGEVEASYELPAVTVKTAELKFTTYELHLAETLRESAAYGIKTGKEWHKWMTLASEKNDVRPLAPLRNGHVVNLMAAGLLNNTLLKLDDERIVLKGSCWKSGNPKTSEEIQEDGTVVEILTTTERFETEITTLSPSGEIQLLTGQKLEEFLTTWMEPLRDHIIDKYQPLYRLDEHEGGMTHALDRLNQGRIVPNTTIRGLLPAQRHAIAAITTRLKTAKDAILVGQMGTGKTVMGPAIASCLGAKRTLVTCPPHLVGKWIREIKHVVPDATVFELKTLADVNDFFNLGKPPVFGVLSTTRASLGSGWEHCYQWRGGVTVQVNGQYKAESPLLKALIAVQKEGSESVTIGGKSFKAKTIYRLAQLTKATSSRGDELPFDSYVLPDLFKKRRLKTAKGDPLYQFARKTANDKWPLATYIQKQYKGQIDLYLCDEAHEMKGADTDRGFAFARLISASKKVVALTGTIYGGKASSLFHLLYRLSDVMREQYEHNDVAKWCEEFGLLQKIERTTTQVSGIRTGNTRSNARIQEIPGASPSMIKWLIERSIFVTMHDMSIALPDYQETAQIIDMDQTMEKTYQRIEAKLKTALRERLQKNDKSLLGAYIQTLVTWPDAPWRKREIRDREDNLILTAEGLPREAGTSPKEIAILEHIQESVSHGRNVLLLCQQTATLDITKEWVAVLEKRGIRARMMRCEPSKREQWIAKAEAEGVQVIIAHPRSVMTGLDILNHPEQIWMGSEFSVYVIRQTSKRGWRIGQKQAVNVTFYAYGESMQERGLRLISAKCRAATKIDGELVQEDSLADFEDSTDIYEVLAKMLTSDNQELRLPAFQEFKMSNEGEHEYMDRPKTTQEIIIDLRTFEAIAPVPFISFETGDGYRYVAEPEMVWKYAKKGELYHLSSERDFEALQKRIDKVAQATPMVEQKEVLETVLEIEATSNQVIPREGVNKKKALALLAEIRPMAEAEDAEEEEGDAREFIPKESKIPPIYANEKSKTSRKETIIHVKLFAGSWTWYLAEYDPETDKAYGYAYDHHYPEGAEWGYISLTELRNLKRIFVERDLWWEPKSFGSFEVWTETPIVEKPTMVKPKVESAVIESVAVVDVETKPLVEEVKLTAVEEDEQPSYERVGNALRVNEAFMRRAVAKGTLKYRSQEMICWGEWTAKKAEATYGISGKIDLAIQQSERPIPTPQEGVPYWCYQPDGTLLVDDRFLDELCMRWDGRKIKIEETGERITYYLTKEASWEVRFWSDELQLLKSEQVQNLIFRVESLPRVVQKGGLEFKRGKFVKVTF